MLSSITPLGERGRNNRWGLTFAAYLIGSVAGGAVVGIATGALGWLALGAIPATVRLAVAAVASAAAVVIETRVSGAVMPTFRRQVNENWLQRYRGWVYGLGFGLQLGAGLVTVMTTVAVPLTFLLAALSASPSAGLAIGGVFGLTRGAMVLPARGVRDQEALLALHGRVAASARMVSGAVAVVMSLAAALAALAAIAG